MRKGLLLRAVVALLILAFLVRVGPTVGAAAGDSFYVQNRQPAAPDYVGTITLYHIVTHRTYQGSVTAFLQERAEAFNKQHFGVRIAVEGMGEQDFVERLSYGRWADMYSFFSGALYEELLQAATFAPEASLRPGLSVTSYAAPWFFQGTYRQNRGRPRLSPPLLTVQLGRSWTCGPGAICSGAAKGGERRPSLGLSPTRYAIWAWIGTLRPKRSSGACNSMISFCRNPFRGCCQPWVPSPCARIPPVPTATGCW